MADELTEDLLSAYADDELDAPTRARVEARLADDESWRAVLEEIEETRALVRGATLRDAPSGFWPEVRHAVAADADEPEPVAVPTTVTPMRSRRRTRWSIAAAVAAAAVVVAVVVVPTRARTRPPVATLVDTHAARASLTGEPVSTLSPMSGAPRLGR